MAKKLISDIHIALGKEHDVDDLVDAFKSNLTPRRTPTVNHDYLNHHPFYPGRWHEFNGHAYTLPYYLRLKDGTVLGGEQPECGLHTRWDGNRFNVISNTVPDSTNDSHISVSPEEVAFVYIPTKEELSYCHSAQLMLEVHQDPDWLEQVYGNLLPEIGIGDHGDLLYLKPRELNNEN